MSEDFCSVCRPGDEAVAAGHQAEMQTAGRLQASRCGKQHWMRLETCRKSLHLTIFVGLSIPAIMIDNLRSYNYIQQMHIL